MGPHSPFGGQGPFGGQPPGQPHNPQGGGQPPNLDGLCQQVYLADQMLGGLLAKIDALTGEICRAHDQNQRRMLCQQLTAFLSQLTVACNAVTRAISTLLAGCR